MTEDLTRRLMELETEVSEQCRLNGLGAEREARLMARVEELERAVHRWHNEANSAAERAKAAEDKIRELEKALNRIKGLGRGPDRGSAQWQIDCAVSIAEAATLRPSNQII